MELSLLPIDGLSSHASLMLTWKRSNAIRVRTLS